MSATPTQFVLAGRDIWIFGGAGYLGRSVVTQLAALEARVLCADMADKAHQMVEDGGLQPQVTPATLDINDLAATDAFVREQIALRGIPHGLVVMTCASTKNEFDTTPAEDFDRINHGNLTATFALARAIGQLMAERGSGSIILFSSMYGTVSPDPRMYEAPMVPNPIEYGVGKAGIQQMARYFSVQWGRSGVRCNCISPGPFPNPVIQRENPAFMDRLAHKVPLGRIGLADEMAGPVAFLLSDSSSYINGHNLAVDGGWTAW